MDICSLTHIQEDGMEKERIIRLEKNISLSRINQKQIGTLPQGLRELAERFLTRAVGVKQIIVDDNLHLSLVEFSDCYDTIGSLSPEAKMNFEDLIFLYRWYIKEHWIGSCSTRSVCAECQREPLCLGDSNIYCTNPQCSSHDIWWQIIGPTYKYPAGSASVRI